MKDKIDNTQRRLALMEALLLWEGRLNNGRLRALFGLSKVRASEWIREFREARPEWTYWDSKVRSYYAGPDAYRGARNAADRRLADAVSLSRYLGLVGIPYATNGATSGSTIWSAFPDISVPTPRIFSVVAEAIRTHKALQITYRSMRQPEPHQRTISPHSLIRAGRRWHIRAFCATNQDFRDYTLGRIERAKLLSTSAERTEQDDTAWTAMVPVRLVAHPDLTPEQETVIRFEYFNNTAARVESCRGALLGYFIQDVRAATDTKNQRPPDYQLAVENIEELRPWLFPA